MSLINTRSPQVVTDTHKKCSRCSGIKVFSDFYKDSRNKNGNNLTHNCKDCVNKIQKESHKYSDTPYAAQVVTDTHKSCSVCRKLKPFFNFHNDKKNAKGNFLCYSCKECANIRSRHHHKNRAESIEYKTAKKDSHIKHTYNISLDDYLKKLSDQNYKCTICSVHLQTSGTKTHLDHDHLTGKLRNFLCSSCNRGLGFFKENKEILMSAIHYLESHTDNGNQKEGNCP